MMIAWVKTVVGAILTVNFSVPLITVVSNRHLWEESMAVIAGHLSFTCTLFGCFLALIGLYDVAGFQSIALCRLLLYCGATVFIAIKMSQVCAAVDQFVAVVYPLRHFSIIKSALPWFFAATWLIWAAHMIFGFFAHTFDMKMPSDEIGHDNNSNVAFTGCNGETGLADVYTILMELERVALSLVNASLLVYTGVVGYRSKRRLVLEQQQLRQNDTSASDNQTFFANYRAFKHITVVLSLTISLDIVPTLIRISSRWHFSPQLRSLLTLARLTSIIFEGWAYGLLNTKLRAAYKKMLCESEEMRSKAAALCRDYLHGAWQLIAPEEMVFRPISGGLSNLLYFCQLPSYQAPLGDEPAGVLLRLYGQVRDGAHDSTITESVIFTLLAERQLGPKLYGIFPGGRLEQYIQALPLSCSDLRDPQISPKIAERMAMVHSLEVPICKEPTFLWTTMKKWIQLSVASLSDATLAENPEKDAVIKALRLCDYEQEMEWMKKYISHVSSPVKFCHNDCQEGNILRHDTGTDGRPPRLTLIDYEYCSYNYRGFDLANHFCEWMYDYSLRQYPHFTALTGQWPSREQQLRYIRAYLRTRHSDKGAAASPQADSAKAEAEAAMVGNETRADSESRGGRSGPDPEPELEPESGSGAQAAEEERLLQEVRVFTLASHLFWTLWSVVNAPVSTIAFGYWEYGLCRLSAYQDHKQLLLASDPKCPKMEQGMKRPASELE